MRPQLEGKTGWTGPVIMEALSQRYGWKPDEIRTMQARDVNQYLEIIKQEYEIQKAHRFKNKDKK